MDTLAGLPNGGASLNNMAILPATLWVDVDGYRFTNEDICYDSAYIGNVTAQAGINASNLVKTVETYNAYCEAGVDGMYSKDSQFLCAIEDGPYYVVTGRATELCTLGGLKISTDFEVVNTENAVIPGLYSAGVDCSGSLYNNSYVSYEGVTMGWCTTFGRLAGANAAAYATK